MIVYSGSWAWGMPLIVLAVIFHVSGLWLFSSVAMRTESPLFRNTQSYWLFALYLGAAVLLVATLHAAEALGWAVAYTALGALPDIHLAMLYSLSAMTTYGHENSDLEIHWRLMGALEALNGMLLFGLSTAFLFAVAQRVLPSSFAEGDAANNRNRSG